MEVPVVVDALRLGRVMTDLGYEVEVTEARIAVRDLTFAIAGEEHTASLLQTTYEWLVPPVLAHPGHSQGGDITGEMPGSFLLDWLPGRDTSLGSATLLVGKYSNANFTFSRASEAQVSKDDSLLGHTAILRGSAKKDSRRVAFLALIDSPIDRELVGIPFEFDLKEASKVRLHLQLKTLDELEGDTLFDGLDFLALDDESDGELEIIPNAEPEELLEAYNLLRRALQTHDHFEVKAISFN